MLERRGEYFYLQTPVPHRVRPGRRPAHHFGFLTHCRVKMRNVFDRSCSSFLLRVGGWRPGMEPENLFGTFSHWNQNI